MAIAHTQTPAGGVSNAPVTSVGLAFGSNVTVTGAIIGLWRYSVGGQTVTLSDTLLNTFVSNDVQAIDTGDANSTSGIGYALNSPAGADTVTFAISGAAQTLRFTTSEFSGVATSGARDKTATAIGTSTAPASGAVTPTTDGQLFFAGSDVSNNVTFTAGTDFTINTTVPTTVGSQRLGSERYIQPIAASHNGDFSIGSSIAWGCVLATFKAAATNSMGQLLTLRVG